MPITEKTDVFLRQASADYKGYNFLDFEYMQLRVLIVFCVCLALFDELSVILRQCLPNWCYCDIMDALEIMNVSSGTSKANLHFPLLSGRKFEMSTFKDSFLRNTYELPKANNSGRLIAERGFDWSRTVLLQNTRFFQWSRFFFTRYNMPERLLLHQFNLKDRNKDCKLVTRVRKTKNCLQL